MTGVSMLVVVGVGTAALVAFLLAATQSYLNRSIGTDHAVHAFLVRAVRHNGRRLFVRVPNLINETHCAALPLYLHWTFSWFGARTMRRAERLLNPIINAALVGLFGILAWVVGGEIEAPAWFTPLATAAFALTPQFYHALSARNFGLSARGIGLFLLTGVFMLGWAIDAGAGVAGWIAIGLVAYLLWAFNTFGAQAMVILSVLTAVLFGHWIPLAGGAAGLAIFIAIHPAYATRYLYHTLRFIIAYATQALEVAVLARRYSLWRDLVWDIWRRIAAAPIQGIRYAYENSVLIVIVLNPLWTITAVAWTMHVLPREGLIGYATDIALTGGLGALLTSFRPTRFLGEPERYVEAVTPFAAIAGCAALLNWIGPVAIAVAIVIFLTTALAQVYASRILQRYVATKPINLAGIASGATALTGPIRCAGNNDQIIKQLLTNDWQFVYCMAIEGTHCGMPLKEVFSVFPFVRREALQRIVTELAINLCVLDRTLFDTLFDDDDPRAAACRIVFENEQLRVIGIAPALSAA